MIKGEKGEDVGYAGFCFDQWPDRTKKQVKFDHSCEDYEPREWVRGSTNSPDLREAKRTHENLTKRIIRPR